jgi:aspartate/methionine/tyrosine aminotransferase
MEIAVEFTSMSKTYSMPGWRIGFAVGNERLVAALTRVKSYLDYGAFTPIQVAATYAINTQDHEIEKARQIYRQRRDVMVDAFARAGWDVPPPPATMFAWAPIPENSRSCWSKRLMLPFLQASASARTAISLSGWLWWRTNTGSARPRATSRSSWPAPTRRCTTSSRLRRGAERNPAAGAGKD